MKVFPHLCLGAILIFQSQAGTITVTTSADQSSGGLVSLRDAIQIVGQGAGTICFDAGLSGATFRLNNLGLTVSSPTGTPGGAVTIDASGLAAPPILVPGTNPGNVVLLSGSRRPIILKNLIFSECVRTGASVILGEGSMRLEDCVFRQNRGHGLQSNGTSLTLNRCQFQDNDRGFNGGNLAQLTVEGCSFYHNRDKAFFVTANLDTTSIGFSNCTVAENAAAIAGQSLAGIGLANINATPSISVNHCSFVDNAGPALGGPDFMVVSNSLFARNLDAAGILTSIVEDTSGLVDLGAVSGGYNIADDAPAALNAGTDLANTNARVSRIGYHGGHGVSCLPLAGSPAIDGGNANRFSAIPGADGRGFFRNASSNFLATGNPIDIGAVETNPYGAIAITSSADSGPGTLRDAIATALSQSVVSSPATHHLIVDSALSGHTLTLSSVLFIEATRNLNIDGSALETPLTITGQSGNNLFTLASNEDERLTGSLHGFHLRDFANPGNAGSRTCLSVTGGTRFGFQRVRLEDNQPSGVGAIDVSDHASVYLDECLLSENMQLETSLGTALGGAALSLRTNAMTTVWNSSFIGNEATAETTSDGGAIWLDTTARLALRNSTFARNEAAQYGSCIHVEVDASGGGSALIDRCTFAENVATEGALSASTGSSLIVSASVFSQNKNAMGSPSNTVDLYATGGSRPSVLGHSQNWTNAEASIVGFVPVMIPDFELAPPAFYGSPIVRTMPFLTASLSGIDPLAFLNRGYPRDAHHAVGFNRPSGGIGFVANPGAVQVPLTIDEVFSIGSSGIDGNQFRYEVAAPQGLLWRLETSPNHSDWTPGSQTFPGGGLTTLSVTLPIPIPDRLFVRFIEVSP